jgi:GNAT superfamily N-acetyltransferase
MAGIISNLPVPEGGQIAALDVPQTNPGVTPQEADVNAFKATSGSLRQGFRSGMNSVGAMLQGIVGQTGEALGLTEFANDRFNEAKAYTQMAEATSPDVRDIGKVKSFNTLTQFVLGHMGSGTATSIPAVGAAVGLRRPVAGLMAGAAPLEAGEQALKLRDDPTVMANTTPGQRLANSAQKGVINAGLEVFGAEGQVARKILNPKSAVGGVGKAIAKGTVGEGVTEGIQEVVGTKMHQQLNPDVKIDTHEVLNAAAAGAAGGGAMTGTAHAAAALPGALARTSDELRTRLGKKDKPHDPEGFPEGITELNETAVLEKLKEYDAKTREVYGEVTDPEKYKEAFQKAKQVYADSEIKPKVDALLSGATKFIESKRTEGKKSEMRTRVDDDILDFVTQNLDPDIVENTEPAKLRQLGDLIKKVAQDPMQFKDTGLYRTVKKVMGPKFKEMTDFAVDKLYGHDPQVAEQFKKDVLAAFPERRPDEEFRLKKAEAIIRTFARPDYSIKPDMRKAMIEELAPQMVDFIERGVTSRTPEQDAEYNEQFAARMDEAFGENKEQVLDALEELRNTKPVTSGRAFEGAQGFDPSSVEDEAGSYDDSNSQEDIEAGATTASIMADNPRADARLDKIYKSKDEAEAGAKALREEYGPKTLKFTAKELGDLGEEGHGKWQVIADDADQEGLTPAELRHVREPASIGASGLKNGILIMRTDAHPAGIKINLRKLTHLMMRQEGQQSQEGGAKFVADMFARGMSSLMSTPGFRKFVANGKGDPLPESKGKWALPDDTPIAVLAKHEYTYADIKVYRISRMELKNITKEDIKHEIDYLKDTAQGKTLSPAALRLMAIERVVERQREFDMEQTLREPGDDVAFEDTVDSPDYAAQQALKEKQNPKQRVYEEDTGKSTEGVVESAGAPDADTKAKSGPVNVVVENKNRAKKSESEPVTASYGGRKTSPAFAPLSEKQLREPMTEEELRVIAERRAKYEARQNANPLSDRNVEKALNPTEKLIKYILNPRRTSENTFERWVNHYFPDPAKTAESERMSAEEARKIAELAKDIDDAMPKFNLQGVKPSGLQLFNQRLSEKYPDVEIKLAYHGHSIALNILEVSKKAGRGKGLGTKVMRDIIRYADANNKGVFLQASPLEDEVTGETSISLPDLEKFYSKFGFKAFPPEEQEYPGMMTEMYREPIGEYDDGPEEALQDLDTSGEGSTNEAGASEGATPISEGQEDSLDFTKLSTQNIGLDGEITPEQQAEVKAYVERVLGPKAKALFKDMAHAGEFIKDKSGVETLVIALRAIDPMSVAYHEALHAFFARLIKVDQRAAATLLRAASSPPIVARLRQLLKGQEAALAQLKDPEERLAYMYQFSAAGEKGLINIGPDTKSWFDKTKDFFRKIAAIWSDEMTTAMAVERSGSILDAFHHGAFANRSTVAEVLADKFPPDARQKADRIFPQLGRFLDKFIWTASGAVRDMDYAPLTEVIDKFHSETGQGEPGFLQSKHVEFNRFMNRINDAVKGMNREEQRKVLMELQSKKRESKAAKAIEKVLEDAHAYMVKSGVKVPKWDEKTKQYEYHDIGKVVNYFPRSPDQDYLREHKDEFMALLKKHNIKDGEKIYEKMTQDVSAGNPREDIVLGLTYFTPQTNERGLTNFSDEELAPFMSKDLYGTLSQYFQRAVRRAEYTKRFGNMGEKIQEALVESRKLGLTPTQEKTVKEVVEAMEGTLGANMSKELKQVYGALTTYQNIRLLPLALFSSLVDPMGIVVRGGTLGEGVKAFGRGLRELAGYKDDDAYQLAQTIGAINTAHDAEVIGDMYSSQFMPTLQKRINDKFFKYIGMESYNRSMRVAASAAAQQFLIRHVTKPNAHSDRYLTELGLEKSDVIVNDGKLELNDKVIRALNLWVDQAILRPNAALRPVYMSDPNWILISHLKQYTYMFQKVIIARVNHELQHGNYTPAMALAGYVPIIIASDMMRVMLTPGGGDDAAKEGWTALDWLWRGIQRAGLFGPGQYALDSANDFQMNHFGIESLVGPTGQQLLDFVRASARGEGIGREAVKAIPGVRLFQ